MARTNGVSGPEIEEEQAPKLGVSLLAVSFGLVAIGLSFLAYNHRIKLEDVKVTSDGCSYPHSASFELGIVAALSLLIEQLIISSGIGCFCCGGTNKCPTTHCDDIISLVYFFLSWLSFIIAFVDLIYAAIWNNNSYLASTYTGHDDKCEIGKDNLFLNGAYWCILTVVYGLASHIAFKSGNKSSSNVANAQP